MLLSNYWRNLWFRSKNTIEWNLHGIKMKYYQRRIKDNRKEFLHFCKTQQFYILYVFISNFEMLFPFDQILLYFIITFKIPWFIFILFGKIYVGVECKNVSIILLADVPFNEGQQATDKLIYIACFLCYGQFYVILVSLSLKTTICQLAITTLFCASNTIYYFE